MKKSKGAMKEVLLVSLLVAVLGCIGSQLEYLEAQGMPLLLFFQKLRSPPLDAFVRIFSALGMEVFFLFIPFSMFWLRRNNIQQHPHPKSAWKQQWPLGMELLFLLVLTWFCNSTLKTLFARPRPWVVHSHISVHHSTRDEEFSFPSGHSWASAGTWLFLYYRLQHFPDFMPLLRWIATRFGMLFTFLTSLSRVYFGVHYPHDILSGWLCAILLFTFYKHVFINHNTHNAHNTHNNSDKSEETKENRNNNNNESGVVELDWMRIISLAVVIILMICVVFILHGEATSDHVGFFYCPGVVLAIWLSLITNPYLAFHFRRKSKVKNETEESKNESRAVSHGIQLLRFLVGISGGAMVMLNKQWVIANSFNSFSAGFLSASWLVWGAPLSFYLLNLN